MTEFLAAEFGWKPELIADLGGIDASRGTEMFLAFWIRMMMVIGHGHFSVEVRIGKQ